MNYKGVTEGMENHKVVEDSPYGRIIMLAIKGGKIYTITKGAVDVPMLVNIGVKPQNVGKCLSVADGAIVGSSLKEDGYTWNSVDPRRVEQLMEQVQQARRSAK